MRKGRLAAIVAAPLAVALLATGCGGGAGGASEDGVITVNTTEPENPLVPGNTTETGGGKVVDALFTGLMRYSPDDGTAQLAHAESITPSENNTKFTVKLKPGWTFHDGSPVTAESYVRAWNYNAYGPNGMSTESFFSNIQGYEQVTSEDPDGDDGPQQAPPPEAEQMSGLQVIDENTFEVTLSEPFSSFPITLGYTAFSPLPNAFFDNKEAFEENPIGNGPFRFDSREPNTDIRVRAFDEYQGEDKPSIRGVDFIVYNELEGAYQDVISGNLDFINQVPPSALVDEKWRQDLGDRALEKKGLLNTALDFPLYDEKYQDPKVRKAISLAINREEIAQQVFNGSRTPSTGYVPEGLPGYETGACGEACEFNPERAKQLMSETDFQGPVTITSNADGGHKEWIDAVCGNIRNNLGLECGFNPVPTFSEFLTMHNEKSHTGPFRFGWVGDYPSPETFLAKIYKTGASSNYKGYSNPAFDQKINEANAAPTVEEANALYREAEQILVEDMPSIPLFDQSAQAGHSERLTNVKVTPFRELDLASVRLTEQ